MSFRCYPKYKDSGVEWLGEVPEHWECRSLGSVTQEKCDGPFGSGLKSEHYVGSGVRVVRLQNIRSGLFDDRDEAYIDDGYFRHELTRHAVHAGDVLIAGLGDERNTVGRACVAPRDIDPAIVKADCFRFRLDNRQADPQFVALQLSAGANADAGRLATGSTRSRVPLSDTASRRLALPPLGEQQAIVRFLAHEVSLIDTLATEQQRLIDLLIEKRKALIAHVTNKGLDERAPRKYSGVEWIGNVPKHWRVRKLASLVQEIGSGTTPSSDRSEFYDEGTVPWLNTGDLNDGYLEQCDKCVTHAAMEAYGSLKLYAPGSVVIAMYGATIGKLGILRFSAAVNQACCVFTCDATLSPEFLFYWLLGSRDGIVSLALGGGQPNVSQALLRNLRVPCPPGAEQAAIVAILTGEMAKYDALVDEAERTISLLDERRSSLISAAVTGKIDVRNYAASQAEAA